MARKREAARATAAAGETETFVVEMWDIDRPQDYPQNAKDHTDEAVEKLAAIIRRVGLQVPIVVDEAGVIAKGHRTRRACKRLGYARIPVKVAHGVAEPELREWRLADNRSPLDSLWNEGNLGLEFADLESLGRPLSNTGFDQAEIDRILGSEAEAIEPIDVRPLPTMTWVLIGCPTVRFPEIAELVDAAQMIPDVIVEMTANSDAPAGA